MTIENNNNNNYENEYDNNNEGHKPVKTIILTDRQSLILETMITQRTTRQALEFQRKWLFYQWKDLKKRETNYLGKNLKRLFQIAKIDFQNQHIERIEKLRYIEREMWQDVGECQDQYKRLKMKESIQICSQ